jgi:hypothetical protein
MRHDFGLCFRKLADIGFIRQEEPSFIQLIHNFFYALESLNCIFKELQTPYVVGIILTAHYIGRKLHFH